MILAPLAPVNLLPGIGCKRNLVWCHAVRKEHGVLAIPPGAGRNQPVETKEICRISDGLGPAVISA